MPDVFISYNRQDREVAQRIATALKEEGLDVWWDAALRAGEAYDEVTERNLREAGAVVVLWSPRSANSKWVRAEATVGERSSTLVPVLIEDCDRPLRFELVQTADLRHWRGERTDSAWRLFVLDIKEALDKSRSAPVASAAAAAQDSSIETAFWTSIKDSREAAEFEAYLGRYPKGHFAELARSRLANLSKPEPRQAPAQSRSTPARDETVQTRAGALTRREAPASVHREKSSGGLNPVVIIGAVLGLGAFAGGVYFLTKSPPAESAAAERLVETAAVAEPVAASPAVEAPAAPSIEEEGPPAAVSQQATAPSAEKTYTDCSDCPTMMRIPGGVFRMGSPDDERGRNPWEGPQHDVTVPAFAIAVSETTEAQWEACVAESACVRKRSNGDPKMPALGVTWREAQGYAAWLSKKTGKAYRLPSEAEWEYAARGGTQTAYVSGDRFEAAKTARGGPKPTGSFDANGFGLADMNGNAREWVEDCYVNNFTATPTDGSAHRGGDCALGVIRDGSWSSSASDMRVANRGRLPRHSTANYVGFRVAGPAE